MFTSAERRADAEASNEELSDGERAVLIEVVISSIGGRTTGAGGAVPSVAFSGGRGTTFLGMGACACFVVVDIAEFGLMSGITSVGNVMVGTTKMVEEAVCAAGTVESPTVTLPEKDARRAARTRAATMPR